MARRASPSAIRARAPSTAPGATSYSATSSPASSATWAIPAPIVPAPTTPTRIGVSVGGGTIVTPL